MKKVLVRKYIPPRPCDATKPIRVTINLVTGSGRYTDYDRPGTFHCWGNELVETSESNHSVTVGIIEFEDGTVEMINPSNIKFII